MKNFFENITVDNFKVFKDSKSIRLAPINILIGKNNSGKSTLMELMKLIKVSLDQSSLNKLMFSKLDGFQSFDKFKTYGYNKKIIKLSIPFQLDWFEDNTCAEAPEFDTTRGIFYTKDRSFLLSFEYRRSEKNILDGILYKYEITDNTGDTIYKIERKEWDENHQDWDQDKEYINERNLILGDFFINYKKISYWMDEFYGMKQLTLELLKDDLIRSGFTVKEGVGAEEMFPTLDSESGKRNMLAMQQFVEKNSKTKFDKGIVKDLEAAPTHRTKSITEDLNAALESEEYNGANIKLDQFDIASQFEGREEIVSESIVLKDMCKDFSITMWNEIMKSSLLFEYDNEDGSPISKKQIKIIRKIEEDLLKEHHAIADNSPEFYERKYDLEVISDKVKAKLFEAEGKVRILFSQNEYTDEITMRYTSYGIFINNIINALSSIPNMVFKSDDINTSDVDTVKNDITDFLKPIYNNPLEDYQKDFVNKWLKEFSYTDDSGYEIKMLGNELNIEFNSGRTSIDSYGKGLQELMYLIFNIAKQKNTKGSVMLVVEPEAHLHPNFQSLLADMFADATKEFNIKFIIESHSEYLLRKLQYLTISKEIKAGMDTSYFSKTLDKFIEKKEFGDVIVNYFDNSPESNTTAINQIYIDKYGNLSDDLGEGFTDHTPKLMMDILSLKNKK